MKSSAAFKGKTKGQGVLRIPARDGTQKNRLGFLRNDDGLSPMSWALYEAVFTIMSFRYHNNPHLRVGMSEAQ